jgi:general secretion pathway protein M
MLIGGVAIVLYLFWVALMVPLQERREAQLQANAAIIQSLGRVQILAARLEQYRADARQAGSAGSSDISALIDSSLQANNLRMSGLQPGTGGEVRLRLDRVPYDRFMQWLYDMEFRHDVNVRELSMAGTNEPGQVTVNIRLQKN